ncbi:bacteriochlorophyll 4-vinyl reductase [Thermaurantiacus sp.]
MRAEARPRIGPNAVTQLAEAARILGAEAIVGNAFRRSGHAVWFDRPPQDMLDEADVAAVHEALWCEAPADVARALVVEAGRRTADYVIENRIPPAARQLLEALPAALAEPLLLKAIARHAWTFAGSGEFLPVRDGLARFTIRANPLASPRAGHCLWHESVFTRMWQRLVTPRVLVEELSCCGQGAPSCRFRVARD